MINTIKEVAKKLKSSDPIFVPDITYEDPLDDGSGSGVCKADRVRFRVENEYDAKSDIDENDPIERLVAEQWNEQFDNETKQFVGSVSENGVRTRLNGIICRALVSASPLKNPEQSKLYKFIYNLDVNGLELQELYISLYKYIAPYTDEKNRFYQGTDCPHAKNFIAILEKVRAKYER